MKLTLQWNPLKDTLDLGPRSSFGSQLSNDPPPPFLANKCGPGGQPWLPKVDSVS